MATKTHATYRAYFYRSRSDDKHILTPTDRDRAYKQLDHLCDTGKATGGGVEMQIEMAGNTTEWFLDSEIEE